MRFSARNAENRIQKIDMYHAAAHPERVEGQAKSAAV
jgi:hypothetical protein